MKSTLKTIAVLGLFFGLAIASVQAQSSIRMTVNIPFDFTAGSAKLKAGEYSINPASGRIMMISAVGHTKDVFVLTPYTVQRSGRDLSGKLVFHRYGDEYFLAQSWVSSERYGSGLNKSGAERRFEQQLARTNEQPETIEILASVR
jgi:hypothetical protein